MFSLLYLSALLLFRGQGPAQWDGLLASSFNLALAQSGLEKDPDTAASYQRVLELKPGIYEAELNLGILNLRDGQPADAVPLLKRAIASPPNKARGLRYRGDALIASGGFPAAQESYESALEVDPTLAPAELGLDHTICRQGRLDDALRHFTDASQFQGDPVRPLQEAANAYVLAELYPQAIATSDKIHSLKADTAGDYYYRAIVVGKLHQLKPTIAAYQEFLELAQGKYSDQEFIARHRSKLSEGEVNR